MSNTDKTQYAFPIPDTCGRDSGMTLRDYFAAAALTGMLGNRDVDHSSNFRLHAQYAYEHADAMLEARGQ